MSKTYDRISKIKTLLQQINALEEKSKKHQAKFLRPECKQEADDAAELKKIYEEKNSLLESLQLLRDE